MMFRGALVRLAAQYFVLLVLILGCFDLIVYVTVSQALQAKADKDLRTAITQAMNNVTVTGDTVSVTAQALLTPSVADNLVRVLDYNGQEVGQPRAELKKLFNDPSLRAPLGAANAGRPGDTRVSNGTDLYMVAMRPIRSKAKKVIGVLQVALPISWVGDALAAADRPRLPAPARVRRGRVPRVAHAAHSDPDQRRGLVAALQWDVPRIREEHRRGGRTAQPDRGRPDHPRPGRCQAAPPRSPADGTE
jgi:hypothetical protein